ncbi:MAG: hypothetical protein KJ060_04520 [Candidatus Hydrogenedentes bacterium]|nr:hypothetical protein [Candidatus Hydrogenedentota bacterium]
MKKKLAVGCVTVAVVGVVAFAVVVALGSRHFVEGLSNPQLSVFAVPAFPDKALLLYEVGFNDRPFILFVREHQQQDPQFVYTMFDRYFVEFQWTADGEMAVFSLGFGGSGPYRALAYDFSTDTAYLPPDQSDVLRELATDNPGTSTIDDSQAEREALEAAETAILKLAESHGGLSDEVFSRDAVRATAQRIKHSEVPRYH